MAETHAAADAPPPPQLPSPDIGETSGVAAAESEAGLADRTDVGDARDAETDDGCTSALDAADAEADLAEAQLSPSDVGHDAAHDTPTAAGADPDPRKQVEAADQATPGDRVDVGEAARGADNFRRDVTDAQDTDAHPLMRDADGNPVVMPYGQMTGRLPEGYQANHVDQNAAFRSQIPRDAGSSVALMGNAFTDIDSEHYNFHESLENDFWNDYRKDGDSYGELPTCAEYDVAMKSALQKSGFSPEESDSIVLKAQEARATHGLTGESLVPRIPGRLPQRARQEGEG
jgi:hypothetical protein